MDGVVVVVVVVVVLEDDEVSKTFRACFTSVGDGISVLRYLAKGVISCAERERK